ncbi:C-X-C motif chemokine 10 [Labrus mixtus]|uniref:C-X-C motif chemokine 10 n=1 Tax=Labrus mixtus TaxID=508554 RepID=UPI0029C05C76|nr:C-X-C motif chemokine 10 [Labrus mixtus]
MTSTRLIVMTTLTLCFIVGLQASPRSGCFCIRTTPAFIPVRIIDKIEVIPVSGHCRRTEIIVTRRNGSKVCADLNSKWGKAVSRTLLKK